ncbi:MAG: hypothetical protein PVI21_05330 [Candidatus Woesebacteria bacterium]|jgi:hypothetical protein
MRIGCSAFARIADNSTDSPLYALTINRGKELKGRLRLSPPGGALQAHPDARQWLADEFGAHSFEKDNDLRLQVPDHQVSNFANWFSKQESRESTVLGEMYEEFVEEEGFWDESDFTRVEEEFIGFYCLRVKPKKRNGFQPKIRFIEVYNLYVPPMLMRKLREAAAVADGKRLFFVSSSDINCREKTQSRPKITRTAGCLLHPRPQIVIPS